MSRRCENSEKKLVVKKKRCITNKLNQKARNSFNNEAVNSNYINIIYRQANMRSPAEGISTKISSKRS
jgi:hypothetical protein